MYRMPDLADWAYAERAKKKILFLGPSTLYRGVAPYVLNDDEISVFNGGSSGQRIMNSYFLLKYVLERGEIDMLVLDVFPRLWTGSKGVESARDHILNNPEYPAKAFGEMAWASEDVRNLFLGAFYAVKRGLLGRNEIQVTPAKEDDYRGDGFIYTLDSKERKSVDVRSDTASFSFREKRYFKKVQRLCAEKEIKLIVLIPPEVQPTPFVLPLIMDASNILNAQEAVPDSSLFYDNHHLYGRGAEYFSNWLKPRIKTVFNTQ